MIAKQRLWAAFIVAGLVITVDQLSKLWAKSAYAAGRGEIVPGVLELRGFENKGVALGHLWGIGSPLIIILLTLLTGLSIYLYYTRRQPLIWLALGLMIGGIIANMLDRLYGGGVHDFIGVSSALIFNLADVAIVTGAITLVVATWINSAPSGGDQANQPS